jgi:hypothetical protein
LVIRTTAEERVNSPVEPNTDEALNPLLNPNAGECVNGGLRESQSDRENAGVFPNPLEGEKGFEDVKASEWEGSVAE